MALFWPPYFRTKYRSWHDGGIYSDWTKDEMEQKMKSLYRKLEESKRSCDSYEQKVEQLKAKTKQLEKEKLSKEMEIAEMKEEQKSSALKQKLLVKQLKIMRKLHKVDQDEKEILMTEKKKLINERNHFAVVAQHTEDKAHKMAEELQQTKSTVKEMGMFLVLRSLCPRYLDPWFIAFSVFYLFSKVISYRP